MRQIDIVAEDANEETLAGVILLEIGLAVSLKKSASQALRDTPVADPEGTAGRSAPRMSRCRDV